MRDDVSGPPNRKRQRESDYEVDDKDSDARSHPNRKKPKRYVIMSDEEEELSQPEDDPSRDPDYNPFFDEPLFGDLKRRTHEEATSGPKMKEEESTGSNSKQKLLKAPFKEINEDDRFVEDDWYKPRGPDSLRYHYAKEDVQYIFRRREEKQAAAVEKEVIDLTGDSN